LADNIEISGKISDFTYGSLPTAEKNVAFVCGTDMDWRIELSVRDEGENMIPCV
jgi:hypothetical protein